MTRKRATGFTLIEILVALALMALVATLAWRATHSLVDGELRLSNESQRWRTLDVAFARMEADMRQAQPRAIKAEGKPEPAWLAARESNGASAIVFTRAGSEFSVEPGVAGQRIGYRLRDNALEVVYWPALDRERYVAPTAYRLVDDVIGFRITHASSGQWVESWPPSGEADLPRAVRVELALASGELIERWFALR
ncbi:MAG TPA: type II secretion system minor pseudopilin GspJ [Casimicrobiaceae bacterium]|nr:type II secretion system minor pseudopilin GspJ [Casimicrobiaceae bacterium]